MHRVKAHNCVIFHSISKKQSYPDAQETETCPRAPTIMVFGDFLVPIFLARIFGCGATLLVKPNGPIPISELSLSRYLRYVKVDRGPPSKLEL